MAGAQRITMATPAGAGSYAPTAAECRMTTHATAPIWDAVERLTVVAESLPATSTLELELLKVGGDPTVSGDWLSFPLTASAAGLYEDLTFAGWVGVRVRSKSGGTAGSAIVSMRWY